MGSGNIVIRPLSAADLDQAHHIIQVAFGTFMDAPDPEHLLGDANLCHTRWKADPASAFAADFDGVFVGSNFGTAWGSVGFFGPLTIHPVHWDKGIGRQLIGPVLDYLASRSVAHMGLFTFPNSAKHLTLYQRFGFHPRFLNVGLTKPVEPPRSPTLFARFSGLDPGEQTSVLNECRAVTDSIYEGLDVTREITAVESQKLGETVLLTGSDRLMGFAVCHYGPDSEGGSIACYIKFGAVRPGPNAPRDFDLLLAACESFAHELGAPRMIAGVSTGRTEAYRQMLSRGFRIENTGVQMHKPDEPAYHRPNIYVCDDWR